MARTVTTVLAEQFNQLNKEGRKREAEIEADLRMFRFRVQELETQIAIKDASYAAQEEKYYNLTEKLAAMDTVVAELNAQIAQLGRDDDLESRFVEIVRGFLAGNSQKHFEHELKYQPKSLEECESDDLGRT